MCICGCARCRALKITQTNRLLHRIYELLFRRLFSYCAMVILLSFLISHSLMALSQLVTKSGSSLSMIIGLMSICSRVGVRRLVIALERASWWLAALSWMSMSSRYFCLKESFSFSTSVSRSQSLLEDGLWLPVIHLCIVVCQVGNCFMSSPQCCWSCGPSLLLGFRWCVPRAISATFGLLNSVLAGITVLRVLVHLVMPLFGVGVGCSHRAIVMCMCLCRLRVLLCIEMSGSLRMHNSCGYNNDSRNYHMYVYMIGDSLAIKFVIQDSQFDCEYNIILIVEFHSIVHDLCNYYVCVHDWRFISY